MDNFVLVVIAAKAAMTAKDMGECDSTIRRQLSIQVAALRAAAKHAYAPLPGKKR
jgi:hypothetical protein